MELPKSDPYSSKYVRYRDSLKGNLIIIEEKKLKIFNFFKKKLVVEFAHQIDECIYDVAICSRNGDQLVMIHDEKGAVYITLLKITKYKIIDKFKVKWIQEALPSSGKISVSKDDRYVCILLDQWETKMYKISLFEVFGGKLVKKVGLYRRGFIENLCYFGRSCEKYLFFAFLENPNRVCPLVYWPLDETLELLEDDCTDLELEFPISGWIYGLELFVVGRRLRMSKISRGG